MASLVEELQREAIDSTKPVSDLLRKVKLIAFKLGLRQPVSWVDSELNGYREKDVVPEYRILSGQIKARNPYRGWMPVNILNRDFEQAVQNRHMSAPIKEVEHLLEGDGDIVIPLTAEQSSIICEACGSSFFPIVVFVSKNSMVSIIDNVRNQVLDWSLALQRDGINGEGMSFLPEEKAVATQSGDTYNIGSISGGFNGNLGGSVSGNVTASSTVNISHELEKVVALVSQIRGLDSQMGLSPAQQVQLRAHLDELTAEAQSPTPQPSRLRSLLGAIGGLASSVVGNVVSSGVTAAISTIQF